MAKMTIPALMQMKADGAPIAMVTAYDYPGARLAERAGVDMVLVGDSGAQVVLGYSSTVEVTTDELLVLARAVRRGIEHAFVVCDVPFGSTEESDAQAVATAVRFVKEAGADGIKIEGGGDPQLSRIRAIVAAGIPVVGHVGLTPQTATALGGMRAQGRTVASAERIVREALAVQQAGAFAVVVEAVPTEITAVLSGLLDIPIIGIGAGVTDGQVLVMHDLIGITEGKLAKFVKSFGNAGDVIAEAISAYVAEVRAGSFPAAEHEYAAAPDAVEAARQAAAAARK